MKKNRFWFGMILVCLMFFACTAEAFAANINEPKVAVDTAINATAKKLITNVSAPTVSTVGGEWAIIGLARSGYAVPQSYYDSYYAEVVKALQDADGKLTTNKYTEYSRVILALTAIGCDVTNVGGYNLLASLADFNNLKKQGINGPVFALLALDSHAYEIPQVSGVTVRTTRQMLIDYILSKEITVTDGTVGGFSLEGKNPNADVTAMVLQALAKYTNQPKVKLAVDRGLTILSSMQKASGGYASGGIENTESISQVVVALSALGIEQKADSHFIKGSNWSISALMEYYITGGGFKHNADTASEFDMMSTEQAFYGLVAYNRSLNGQNSLYDMTDVKITSNFDDVKDVQYNENQQQFVDILKSMPGISLILLTSGIIH